MRRRTTLAGLAVAAALVVSGCGAGGRPAEGSGAAGPAQGLTDTTIKVGAHFPLTGVAAPGYSDIPTGAKAYFDYVNAAGGVHGRKIEYIFRDDAYNPTQTSQVVNELVLQDQVFAIMGGLGTATHSAVVDFLNSEGVPDLFVSSGSLLWDQPEKRPQTFGWQPDYEVEAKIIGKYVAENLPQAKVGLFLQDDDLGRDAEVGARRFLDPQIVAAQRYTPGNTDVAPQIAALQAAGADLVIGFNVPSYTALSQLQSMRLNYKPQWIYSNIGSDPALVGSLLKRFSEGAVSDAGLLEGMISTEYLPGVDAPTDPWIQLFQKVWDAHGGGGELTNYRVYGMSEAYTFVQALQAAGPDPTREGLVAAVQEKGSTFEGPWSAPFRYSAERHAGISGASVTRITNGVSEELTPVQVTDNGDAPVTTSERSPTVPPASGVPG